MTSNNDLMEEDADAEPGLPRAALNKIIKDTLPHVRVANETRELLYNCCLEHIRTLANEANQLCNQEQRKTISNEHVLKALENLGYGAEYIEAAESVLDNCREQAARRQQRQNSRLEKKGIPEEELLRQQQELFEKARLEDAQKSAQQMALFQQLMVASQQQPQVGAVEAPSGASNGLSSASFQCSGIALDEDYDAPD